jgi:hypothetical protein
MHVKENISVIASFGMPYRIKPVRFRWSGRLHEIKEITYMWKTKDGQKDIYRFSVTTDNSLYELSFDTETLIWTIENLEA